MRVYFRVRNPTSEGIEDLVSETPAPGLRLDLDMALEDEASPSTVVVLTSGVPLAGDLTVPLLSTKRDGVLTELGLGF